MDRDRIWESSLRLELKFTPCRPCTANTRAAISFALPLSMTSMLSPPCIFCLIVPAGFLENPALPALARTPARIGRDCDPVRFPRDGPLDHVPLVVRAVDANPHPGIHFDVFRCHTISSACPFVRVVLSFSQRVFQPYSLEHGLS